MPVVYKPTSVLLFTQPILPTAMSRFTITIVLIAAISAHVNAAPRPSIRTVYPCATQATANSFITKWAPRAREYGICKRAVSCVRRHLRSKLHKSQCITQTSLGSFMGAVTPYCVKLCRKRKIWGTCVRRGAVEKALHRIRKMARGECGKKLVRCVRHVFFDAQHRSPCVPIALLASACNSEFARCKLERYRRMLLHSLRRNAGQI